MSAYMPILEGLDEPQSGAQSGGAQSCDGGAQSGGAQSGGETDLNKIIATINAQSNSPVETTETKAINGIVLNDKYTEQTIDAGALKNLLKNSTQVQAIMNPTLPPAPN